MTFIDIFAGVGGFRKGMELAGHKCLGFCEFDKFAVQSYRAIHKTEGEWYAKDIRTVRADDIPRADCWCAGFPCQDISIAGKQLGFKGKRSSLFFTVTGLIAGLEEKDRPQTLLFENVKNLLSVNRGFDFARLLIELDEIGYDAEWAVLNTADVLPQNRERIFIVGHLRGTDRPKVFPISTNSGKNNELQGQSKLNAQDLKIYQRPRGNNKGGLHAKAPTITSNCYEHNNLVVKQIANIMPTKTRENPNQGRVYDISGIAPSLNCMGGGGRESRIAIPCLTPDRINKRQNGRRFKDNNDPMFTLTAQDKHGVVVGGIYTNDSPDHHRGILEGKSRCLKGNKSDAGVVFIRTATKKGYDIARTNEDSINLTFPDSKTRRGRVGRGKAQTLDTSCNQGVAINGSEYNIRKLTPLECWRLQGWDDEDFFRAFFLDKELAHKFNIAYQRHKHNPVRLMQWAFKHQKTSDSQLYKQAGNGVTTLVVKAIADRLED